MNATRVNSQTLIFTPFDALWPETDYVLTLQRGIRCWRRGPHILEDEFSIAFKTRRWGDPEELSDRGLESPLQRRRP
jgi:hypothetical protein